MIAAPTGSGKTLAAFLVCLDRLWTQACAEQLTDSIHVVYVSPLKALSNDVQKNLLVPLEGIDQGLVTAGLPPRAAATPATGGGHGAAAQGPGRREMTEEERNKAREETAKQIEAMRSQPPAMVEFTLFFDDWRDVSGIKFPHKIRRASAGWSWMKATASCSAARTCGCGSCAARSARQATFQ